MSAGPAAAAAAGSSAAAAMNELLLASVSAGQIDQAQQLLRSGASPDGTLTRASSNGGHLVPLHHAASRGHLLLLDSLIAHGAQLDVRLPDVMGGYTPLHLAVLGGHTKAVEMLLSAGANPNVANAAEQRFTPLHMAARLGQLQTATLLISHGADVQKLDTGGKTPWWWANELGFTEIAQQLPPQDFDWLSHVIREKERARAELGTKPAEKAGKKKGKKGGGKKKGKK